MRAAIAILIVILIASPILATGEESIRVSEEPIAVFIVSEHAGNIFYSNSTTNDMARYQTRFYAYVNVTLHIVGKGLAYNVTLNDRNESYLGSTTDNMTRITIPMNGSSIWLLVFIGNLTYNFGVLGVSLQPSTVTLAPPAPQTITLTEFLSREWRSLLYAAVLAIIGLYAAFLWITRYKRGKVIVR